MDGRRSRVHCHGMGDVFVARKFLFKLMNLRSRSNPTPAHAVHHRVNFRRAYHGRAEDDKTIRGPYWLAAGNCRQIRFHRLNNIPPLVLAPKLRWSPAHALDACKNNIFSIIVHHPIIIPHLRQILLSHCGAVKNDQKSLCLGVM